MLIKTGIPELAMDKQAIRLHQNSTSLNAFTVYRWRLAGISVLGIT